MRSEWPSRPDSFKKCPLKPIFELETTDISNPLYTCLALWGSLEGNKYLMQEMKKIITLKGKNEIKFFFEQFFFQS